MTGAPISDPRVRRAERELVVWCRAAVGQELLLVSAERHCAQQSACDTIKYLHIVARQREIAGLERVVRRSHLVAQGGPLYVAIASPPLAIQLILVNLYLIAE